MKLPTPTFSLCFALFVACGSSQPTTPRPLARRGDVSTYSNSVPRDTGSGQTLAAPTSTLKYVTLGRGTQNYTCASPSATPASIGANATLWDLSPLLNWIPPPWGLKAVLASPRLAINVATDKVPSVVAAQAIGHHYFNGGKQPTFDLGKKGLLVAKKVGDIPAPTDAAPGPLNEPSQDNGAVDWLNLVDAGGSIGLNAVYRVECAGGKAPTTCDKAGPLFQEYACLYWFYG